MKRVNPWIALGVLLLTACPADGAPTDTSAGSAGSAGNTGGPTTGDAMATATTTATTTGTATGTATTTATTGDPGPEGCNAEALVLIDLVNAYRGEHGLPAIPASSSLCTVGQTHVEDLKTNAPHTQPGGCNLHSWSDAGTWTPCCYTPDHAQAQCMWNKPRELTVYPGNGYENGSAGAGTPEAALDGWKNSPAHNDVMLNNGIWADYPWGAIGVGFTDGYAVLWFGVEVDPAG